MTLEISSSSAPFQPRIPSGSSKINKVKTVFSAVIGLGLLLLPPTWIFLAGMKIHSHFKNEAYKESLAIRRFEEVQKALHYEEEFENKGIETRSVKNTFIKQRAELAHHVEELSILLSVTLLDKKGATKIHAHTHMQKVREKIDEALKSEGYREAYASYMDDKKQAIALRKTPPKPFEEVLFIQCAATLMLTKAGSAHEHRDLGENALNLSEDQAQYTPKEAFAEMDAPMRAGIKFNKNHILGKIFHAVTHPLQMVAGVFGETKMGAIQYSPYKNGNFNALGWTYQIDNKEIDFFFSPQTTSDRLYEGMLELYETLGVKTLRHMLETPLKAGEKARRENIIELSERHEESLSLYATSVNGPLWKGKGEFKGIENPSDYFEAVGEYIEEDAGFHLKDVFTDKEIKDALTLATTLFENVEFPKEWTLRRRQQAMLLGFEGILSVKALVKFSEEVESQDLPFGIKPSFMQACKQDVDRGAAFNVMTRVLFRIAAGETLKKEEIEIMTGVLIGRAGLVDDRRIIEERYRSLSDLFSLIGGDVFALGDDAGVTIRDDFNAYLEIDNNTKLSIVDSYDISSTEEQELRNVTDFNGIVISEE